jgi:hypothetical protein
LSQHPSEQAQHHHEIIDDQNGAVRTGDVSVLLPMGRRRVWAMAPPPDGGAWCIGSYRQAPSRTQDAVAF